ncbi:MAG: decaprenyl-phosphate phosphoribosyltransferase, partial [Actinomycetota bacterium]|nr:decaprenyl-phosphate phosphoribosyltransferase [Actinomycetota bacterium]
MTTTRVASPSVSVRAVVKAARPRQWVKNVLVLAAPALGGQIGDTDVLFAAAIAFV